MASYTNVLLDRSKEELVDIITLLLDKYSEKGRIEFISKNISPQAALNEVDNGDSRNFLHRVDSFSSSCLESDYYIDLDYEEEYYDGHSFYDYDDEYIVDFSESEWAQEFVDFFNLSIMYSRNKNYDIAYLSFNKLLGCLYEASEDVEIFGTTEPIDYIKINWDEIFDEYYIAMKNQITDESIIADKVIDIWIYFGENGNVAIMEHLNKIEHIEKAIRKKICENQENWLTQSRLYELLKTYYVKFELDFDDIKNATSLAQYSPMFLIEAAQGYMNREMWNEAVLTIREAIGKIDYERTVESLNKKLVTCLEALNMNVEAYDLAVKMFYDNNSHELYKRARDFAVKKKDLNKFINDMIKYIKVNQQYNSTTILLRILSFEGHTAKLIDEVMKISEYNRHDHLKYVVKSLIYRALGNKDINIPKLKEYIDSLKRSGIEGIADMSRVAEYPENEQYLLFNSIEMLKMMVQFHIAAAKRTRYAAAAYYFSTIKDIYTYLNNDDEFNDYYKSIISANNKRTALKEEMKKIMPWCTFQLDFF